MHFPNVRIFRPHGPLVQFHAHVDERAAAPHVPGEPITRVLMKSAGPVTNAQQTEEMIEQVTWSVVPSLKPKLRLRIRFEWSYEDSCVAANRQPRLIDGAAPRHACPS